MKSRLAEQARQAQFTDVSRMTAEQRLAAFFTHCQLMARLQQAGAAARSKRAASVSRHAD